MRSEKELTKECKLHYGGDEDKFLLYLRTIAEKNLFENNLVTAKMYLNDIKTFTDILKRRK